MSTSQQLLRKLLKATAPEEVTASVSHKTENDERKLKRKRKNAAQSQAVVTQVTQDDVLAWHAQTLLDTDRAMNAMGSKHSNKSAYHQSKRRLEANLDHERCRAKVASGTPRAAARTTPATSRTPHNPTFNKERDRKEKESKRNHKLVKALQTMDATRQKKKAKTIFG